MTFIESCLDDTIIWKQSDKTSRQLYFFKERLTAFKLRSNAREIFYNIQVGLVKRLLFF